MNLDRATAPDPHDFVPAAPASLTVSSADFADGAPLPDNAGHGQGNVRPQLSWTPGPDGTSVYLLLCHDPDAPVLGGFRHWAALVPAAVTSLGSGEDLPAGAAQWGNDYGESGFGGAAPPEGDVPHRYIFSVTALDTADPGVPPEASIAYVQFATLGHVLARGTLTGTYRL